MVDKPLPFFGQLSEKDVLACLNSTPNGLTKDEVKKRLRQYGFNTLTTTKKKHIIAQFLSNFKSPLVLILICVSIVSFFLGERIDALIVFSMVFMSVGLNFFQEHRANRAAEKLKAKIASTA